MSSWQWLLILLPAIPTLLLVVLWLLASREVRVIRHELRRIDNRIQNASERAREIHLQLLRLDVQLKRLRQRAEEDVS